MPSARRKLIISRPTNPPGFDAVGGVLRDHMARTLRPCGIMPNLRRSCPRFPAALPPLPKGPREARPDPSRAWTDARRAAA